MYKKKPALDGERVYFKMCAQQESNLYLQLRRLTLYPLSYGRGNRFNCITYLCYPFSISFLHMGCNLICHLGRVLER